MKHFSFERQLILVLVIFWTLLGLTFAYISYSVAESENSRVLPLHIFAVNLIKFYLWLAFAPLIFLIVRRFQFRDRDSFFFNVLIHGAFCLLFTVLHTAIYTPLVWAIEPRHQLTYPSVATLFEKYLFFGNFYLSVLLYVLLVIIFQAYLLFTKYQTEETRSSQLRAELADARLRTLKMQLQPHFLFNTLHSISALNLASPQKANQMIARLGDFLRMTLERSDEQMVTLDEELEFLRCYLEIEQIRFSDRLTVEYDVPPETLSAQVPHLILQPIVENAVKHGLQTSAKPLKIKISAEVSSHKLILEVANSGALNGNSNGGTKIGLKNVGERLEKLFGSGGTFELRQDGDFVKARVEIAGKNEPRTNTKFHE